MSDHSFDSKPAGGIVFAAAAASTVATLGIVIGLVALFQSRGLPYGEAVIAEHACESKHYVSEKEECVREWVAAARARQFARR